MIIDLHPSSDQLILSVPTQPKPGPGRPKKPRPTHPDTAAFDPTLYLRQEKLNSALELRETATSSLDRPSRENLLAAPTLAFRDDQHGIYIYHGNCLDLMDRIAEKHPDGIFDCIFADPPYFLSNGGVTFLLGAHFSKFDR